MSPLTSDKKSGSLAIQPFMPPKRPQINLDFADLSFSVVERSKFSEKKPILQDLSGSFRSGELTAILGSSGAGKSTLLNILSGYVSVGVSGSIKINGHPVQMKHFRKISSYILQDDLIQPFLTVEESLQIAANLKLGKQFSMTQKKEVVNDILLTLGLEKHRHTRTEKLSGGQRKRVSIALELVHNPPVIFLDEPTTGLDVVSITQVVKLLQKLSRQDRTIICTIHQPSAYICQFFDNMYIMTHGTCIYQGTYNKIVPFLSSLGFDCPKTHNPTDFIMDIVRGDSHDKIHKLSQEIQNGKLVIQAIPDEENENFRKISRVQKISAPLVLTKNEMRFPMSSFQQFLTLFKRKMIQQSRNMAGMWIMLLHHILTGIILGGIFQGVGSNSNRAFENFKFLISVVVFFMYTHVMCPVLLFPIEVKLIRREYFNRWYSLKAYFAAMSLSSLPLHIIFGVLFVLICYIMSDQPIEVYKMLIFTAVGLLTGLASEGLGLTIGSLFSIRNGSIIGPATIVPLLAVSVYGMGYGRSVEPFMKVLMSLSYLRYGLVGFTTTIYNKNRTLECISEEIDYCHYKNSQTLLKDLGMDEDSTITQINGLIVFFILHRITAFIGLKYTLTFDFSNKILNLANKVLRKK